MEGEREKGERGGREKEGRERRERVEKKRGKRAWREEGEGMPIASMLVPRKIQPYGICIHKTVIVKELRQLTLTHLSRDRLLADSLYCSKKTARSLLSLSL